MSTSVLVLGDLCLDTIVSGRLPVTWQEAVAFGEPVFRVPISEHVGGSAFHFARRAAAVGLRPIVVGSVGSDLAGDKVLATLTGEGLDCQIQRSDEAPTAQSIIAYDVNGARLMIASKVSANDNLSAEFARANALMFLHPGFVWLSGHCLRDRAVARWAAVIEILASAREAGAKVLLDVVPHDFYRLFHGFEDLQSAVGPIDGVVADLNTIRRWFYSGGRQESLGLPELEASVADALDLVPFVMLRFHDGTTYQQLSAARTCFRAAETRAVPSTEHLVGYGDFLACIALRGYIDHLVGLTDMSQSPADMERGY